MDPYVTSTPNSTKLPILDTGKFEQWKFIIQQYLQHEHYALWEVIEIQKKGRIKFSNYGLRFFFNIPKGKSEVTHIAPRSQDRSRRESYKKEPKVEEPSHKTMMAIGWDWSFMAEENEASENQALVAEEVVPTEFALMAISSSSSDNEVEARLVEFKINESKFCEKIRVLERDLELKDYKIENLTNELEKVKKERDGIDSKLEKFVNSSKNLDQMLETQRSVKDKMGLGLNEYSVVLPPPVQVYFHIPGQICLATRKLSNKELMLGLNWWGPVCIVGLESEDDYDFDTVAYPCSLWAIHGLILRPASYDGGYVSFGYGGGKITGKGTIKTGRDFKLEDDRHVLLRTPRQQNMYAVDLKDIVKHEVNEEVPESSGITFPTACSKESSKLPSILIVETDCSLLLLPMFHLEISENISPLISSEPPSNALYFGIVRYGGLWFGTPVKGRNTMRQDVACPVDY
ncbi:hypothetical protein Tco_0410839 [Tanacetum coccineum]